MIDAYLSDLCNALAIQSLPKTHFKGVSIDSRSIQPGNLFIALVGDNFDGHDFIDKAVRAGAVAVIASQKTNRADVPIVVLKDSYQALVKIAVWWRNQLNVELIAITGSNGKTTTKEMLKTILSQQAETLATLGNLNNHLGVPLTLCQLSKKHRYGVIEMGANHLGEIAFLSTMVKANIAVVTNVFEAHLGEFGSVANIVKAKGEIYQALGIDDTAIFAADSPYDNDHWRAQIKTKNIYRVDTDIDAENIVQKNDYLLFDLHYQQHKLTIKINFMGKHNVSNAVLAALIALKLGLKMTQVKQGLSLCQPVEGRLKQIKVGNVTFIDDSYNANPTSVKRALDVLGHYSSHKIAILGKMAELGSESELLHRQVGLYAKQCKVNALYIVGEDNYYQQGIVFADIEKLANHLYQHIKKPTVILIKGSRVAGLERVIGAFKKIAREN